MVRQIYTELGLMDDPDEKIAELEAKLELLEKQNNAIQERWAALEQDNES